MNEARRPDFSHPIEVRFRDCDPLGHVNNAVYLTYLEQARLFHWRKLWGFGLEGLPEGTPGIILARAEVDYRRPVKYGEQLEVRIFVAELGRSSFTYDYEVVDAEGRVAVTARTVQVMYDYSAAKPVPIPPDIRQKLTSN